MNTASFELLRLACTEFFRDLPPEEGRCVTDYSEDKRRKALVQQTYRVTIPTFETMYTLKLYPTNNTLLLNRKNYDKFIDDHLPVIHQIMCGAVQDQNLGSVANFNEILGSQMQKNNLDERTRLNGVVYESSARAPSTVASPTSGPCMPSSVPRENNSQKVGDVRCLGRKRPTKSRDAYCEAGLHWIHYFCDKLTESDKDIFHTDPGFIYVCKSCTTLNEDTDLKVPISPRSLGSEASQPSLVMLDISSTSMTNEGTAAAGILEEETGSECQVCHLRIEESPTRCDYCQVECHDSCMVHTSDGSDICLSCAATQAQVEMSSQNGNRGQLTQEAPDQQDHEVSRASENGQSPNERMTAEIRNDRKQGTPSNGHALVAKCSPGNVIGARWGSGPIQQNGTRVRDKKNPMFENFGSAGDQTTEEVGKGPEVTR